MAARPRSHKITIPNLYRKLDKRNGKVYWQYKHPITGKFHSLGCDEDEAKQVASEANVIIAEQRTRQILSINDKIAQLKGSRESITVSEWLDKYITIQEERIKNEELRPNTYKQKIKPVRLFREHCGMQYLKSITTLDISEIVDPVKADGHSRMAQVVRMVLIDIFTLGTCLQATTLHRQPDSPTTKSHDRDYLLWSGRRFSHKQITTQPISRAGCY